MNTKHSEERRLPQTSLVPRLLAESIGAFTLVFVGVASIIITGNLIAIALAHGLAIALMASAFGHVSGGHFNPAVTIGFWVTQRIESIPAVAYILAQLLGGIVGAIAINLLLPASLLEITSSLGTPELDSQISFTAGVAIEAILTFFLVLVIFGTAVDSRGPALGGMAIGLAITMDILAGGALTGAAMNPARALGPALISGTWGNHLVYWIGPIIGGVGAALLYHTILIKDGGTTQT